MAPVFLPVLLLLLSVLPTHCTFLDPSTAQSFGYCDIMHRPDGSVAATNREHTFSGPSWDVSKLVQGGTTYTLNTECTVAIGAGTLKMSIAEHLGSIAWNPNMASANVSLGNWATLSVNYGVDGAFNPSKGDKLIVYVEGAAAGVDLICRSAAPLMPAGTSGGGLKLAAARTNRLIGTAVDDQKLSDPQYARALKADFNFVTCENCMKFDATEANQGSFSFGGGDALVAFAAQNNMTVKGHCLVWGQQLPGWIAGVGDLQKAMVDHINGVVTHYKGKVKYWDVLNEVIDDNPGSQDGMKGTVYQSRLGTGYVEAAFRAAHAADPDALLLANDYGVELMTDKSQRFYDMVSRLVKKGVPIHGVGFQSHFDGTEKLTDMATNMQRFADLGLFIMISELDVQYLKFPGSDQDKLKAQADFYKKVVSICMSQRACKAITTWGVRDSDSWLLTQIGPNEKPLLFDMKYTKKPAYSAVLDALNDQAPATTTRRLLQAEQGTAPLPLGSSSPVSVTFYESPGMRCSDGLGMCGFGNTAAGGTDFLKNALYPLHAASGNFEFLGGCGACGVLHYNGLARGYTITDVTDAIDSLGERDWPPKRAHLDLCCSEFSYFQSLDKGYGIDCSQGGEFTGVWTRVSCETMGHPNWNNDGAVVRIMKWNRYAGALYVARLPGVGW
ncbi:glycoside hydrolase family 10 [Klebsormidium nitens]|uniref:endo-1,4-beta-xylanase n=1 Tax=Klebsormidium nitens TaxID=105231 RepID=A0A1Y1IHV2_KLENI|nr:glycoside hydrolase family 10 [Klebsormidium nitens]|eukprot:GAQ90384.1 glycoside hydrolase family 10 [Klebsormidium nitens]